MSHQGGCLCGAVRYTFSAEPIAAVHCHCSDCQKATGSGFATVFGLSREQLSISGSEHLGRYTVTADSGRDVSRLFCTTCGSPLFTEADNNPELVWVKAGSLDDGAWLQPTDRCWTGSAAPWAPANDALTRHTGNP